MKAHSPHAKPKLGIASRLAVYVRMSQIRSANGASITGIPITKSERKELLESVPLRTFKGGAMGVETFYTIDLYEHPDAAKIRGEV
jgi:hypothetical protein